MRLDSGGTVFMNSRWGYVADYKVLQAGLLEPRLHIQKMQQAAKEVRDAARDVKRADRAKVQ